MLPERSEAKPSVTQRSRLPQIACRAIDSGPKISRMAGASKGEIMRTFFRALLVAALVCQFTLTLPSQKVPQTPTFICQGTFQVPAANYVYFAFQTPGPVTIAGNFQASGGSGNDIEVVIGSRDDVLNALNGHGGNVSYTSGKLTSGKILLSLSQPCDCILALNNRFSVVSAKSVWANVRYTPN